MVKLLAFAPCVALLVSGRSPMPMNVNDVEGEASQQMDAVSEPDFDEVDDQREEERAAYAAQKERAKKADLNFDAVMMQQNLPINAYGGVAYPSVSAPPAAAEAKVEVPLGEYDKVQQTLVAKRRAAQKSLGPAVVLGAALYSGEAKASGLVLRLELGMTLGHPERYKVVPLVGEDVVVVRATVNGEALPLSRQNGYHVWVTRRTGEVTAVLELLVPARGPKGSLEYDFLVARTPVTRFNCRFPVVGLEPRLTAAVQTELRSIPGGTELNAVLTPTTHIHLVGYREVALSEGRDKKIYADTMNLVSVDESSVELFAVARYTILYAGAKQFVLSVPPGMEVVSADAEGAFRYELQHTDEGTLIKGETAYQIRNNFEVSVRLRRPLKRGGEQFVAPVVRCLGVEREQGYLAVEVPGKLQLTEALRREALPVDVRQLPSEMVENAVSPILMAYRYHAARPEVTLDVVRLPEREPAAQSVDRVRAFSVLADDGQLLTDLRITLRNRLLPNLAVLLPHEAQVRSSLIDGEPVKPSLDAQGRLMVPLKRSVGDTDLAPFTVQLVLSQKSPKLGWLGHPELALPALELPTSAVAWTVYVPAKNRYSQLRSVFDAQLQVGTANWHPGYHDSGVATTGVQTTASVPSSADTGALPVRIKLPETGIRLEHARYWLSPGAPVQVSFFYVRSWLRLPFMVAGFVAVLVLLLWVARRQGRQAWLGLAAFIVASALLVPVARWLWWLAVILAGLRVGWERGWGSMLGALPGRWLEAGRVQYATWRASATRIVWPRLLANLALACMLVGMVLAALALGLRLFAILTRPLAG